MLFPTLLLASAAVVAAQDSSSKPTSTRTQTPTSTKQPCLVVSSIVSKPEVSEVPAASAIACLKTVPVDIDGDSKLIDELKVVWQWQSEIGYLKNTPPEWEFGKLDVEATLDSIKAGLTNASSEYDVQTQIQDIVIKSGNFHWNYEPDILNVFRFWRIPDIVSLSDDGTSLPKIYDKDDAVVLQAKGNSSKVSAITKINGEDAYEYLQKQASLQQYIDGDGQLNSMFYKGDTGSISNFQFQARYDSDSTKFTFANGSEAEYDNYAVTDVSWSGVKNGETFFDEFCNSTFNSFNKDDNDLKLGHLHNHAYIPPTYTTPIEKRQSIDTSNYPKPVIEASDGSLAGYFLSGNGYDDVAILKIITFAPDAISDNRFQTIIRDFLKKCQDEKKQKLIIDLRENGGGSVHLLLDAFMQLFPGEVPFSAQRYRAEEQFIKIGDVVSQARDNDTKVNAFDAAVGEKTDFENEFRFWAYWDFVNAKGENFKDWDDFNGPQEFNGDNYTALMRYNYSNANDVSIRPPSFQFTDTSNLTAVFNASNIIMFADGLCGSSCSSFHEELKNIAGIKAVVVGGRPTNKPMQTVTGSKGGEVIPLNYITTYATEIVNATELAGLGDVFKDTKVADLAAVSQVLIRAGTSSTRIQTQDQVRKGDTNGVPLQYIYEAADCKIFYTAKTYADPTAAWKAAWDASLDDKKCVKGSTGHKSSISGGYKPFGPGQLSDDQLPTPNGTANTNPPEVTGSPTAPAPSATNTPGAASRLGGSALMGLVVAATVALL
ncbi:hypothetical protein BDV96DRAFT_489617 [Lophiotrema nucula]|uniref:Uncharacterized protein n=1 Tax=Lophiotrema nucula TaxID=690887 RepID=A0A6A5ZFX3_9PLEO|nr:hypothetical protein BDV96DRAFT_489617 [Lophiotrema nucula]